MPRFLLTILSLLPCLTLPILAHAEDTAPPSWSFDIKGGRFAPALKNWETYYGSDTLPQFSAALAWKPLRMLDVGVEAAYLHDSGVGDFPLQGGQGGDVSYTLYPLGVYAVARGVFHEGQWFVPYIGAGATRVYYEQRIKFQDKVQGKTNGVYYKGGLQLLLDNLDRGASNNLASHGINNTYLIIEAQRLNAEIDHVKLGGTSYQMGLLFEF
jgi:opacity protein-like surface antigen